MGVQSHYACGRRLSAGFTIESETPLTQETKLSPDGQLGIEVVNLGTQPMYLKNIAAQVSGRTVHFYQHDPLSTKDSMRRLEPGEAATYTVDWQFADQTLRNPDKEKVVVQVETTKKAFSQDVQINPVIVTAEFPLLGRNFTQLMLIRPGRKKNKKAHQ
jgi:hypothetical protein